LIKWIGSRDQFDAAKGSMGLDDFKPVSLQGLTVVPAFTECHTHLVFAGDRSNEFEMRNQGASYQEIAKKGGGILSTVKATREMSDEELLRLAQQRVDRFVSQGVTTVEVKSGYGLSHDEEIKMLRVAKSLNGPKIVTTFLGAHAIPPGRQKDQYLEELVEKTLPAVAEQELADRVDIFIEKGFFSVADGERYLKAAKQLGFALTAHVEQLSHLGGAKLAAGFGAQCVDHVVEITDEDIRMLAQDEAPVCVLLPAADFYLKMAYPKARRLIDEGAVVALATDFNPGSSPTQSVNFVGVLARLNMNMSLSEVLCSYIYGAAKALGLQSERGSLSAGKVCD
ncbi:MAG: imidazolonepropionase, partial [Pseudomonadota bacterium]